MSVSKNSSSNRGGNVDNPNTYIKRVKKANAYVRTRFEKGIQKQEWFRDLDCTIQITK
jgi:hypothetical protein